MRCPYCSDETNRVIDSRLGRDGAEIRRRRECLECGRRFTTRERVEEVLPKVVKRDERREEFWREKLLAGVRRACDKRPVPSDATRAAGRPRRARGAGARREGGHAAASSASGCSTSWSSIDVLAAARFASVFLDFQNAKDYAEFFESASRRGSTA